MPHDASTPAPELRITAPCPMKWSELAGDERRRYCGQCSLHVLNAAALTAREAREVLTTATQRVCMRVEYDALGRPIHSDSARAYADARAPSTGLRRLARWAASAAAGVLAACTGSSTPTCPPAQPGAAIGTPTGTPTSRLGEVERLIVLGEVVAPEPPTPVAGGEEVGKVAPLGPPRQR